jgi:hypothetical protein
MNSMKRSVLKLSCTLLLIFGGVFCSFAQETKRNDRPQSDQTTPDRKPADPTRYFYEFKQPEFNISHILIEHDALGRGKISFERKGGQDPAVEPVDLSSTALARILGLWAELRFLDSHQSYQASKNFAHLGTYMLSMDDGRRKRSAEFNWSNNTAAWKLAQEYRRVADQAIFVFEVTVARENQPLNTPGLMTQLESLYRRNGLSDPKQLVPLLKDLRTDEHIPLIARNQADRLLKKIEK